MKWTLEERVILENEGFKTYMFVAYHGTSEIVKEAVHNPRLGKEMARYRTVTMKTKKGVDGDASEAWTHLSYDTIEKAIERAKRAWK